MKRLYLDTAKVTFMVTKPAEEKSDGSGNQRRTKEGVPMWTVELLAQQEQGGAVINVTMAGEKPSVTAGQVVSLEGLEVIPWNQNGRHGNAFRASGIRPVAAGKAAA